MNLRDPRTQLSWLLILIFLSATFFYKDISLLKNLVIATSSAVIFDFLFLKLRKVELFPPAAAITTGVIISLLMSPKLPVYEIIIASFLAILSKNFIKGENRHIFNPAGFGILSTTILMNNNVSWWAVSFQNSIFPYIFLLLPTLVSMLRLKRFKITLPFLFLYSILSFLMNSKLSILNYVIDPTVIFFSTVMLPEPMTTPNKTGRQIAFGIFVAIFSFFLSMPLLHNLKIANPLIFSLLIGNLVFYRLK